MTWTKHSQQACAWNRPKPHRDPSLRFMAHGPIQPMQERGVWEKLFGRGR